MYKVTVKTMSMLKNDTVMTCTEKTFTKEENAQIYADIWRKFSNMQVSIETIND